MTQVTEWWTTFFSGPVVESWRKFPTAEMTRGEADSIEKALELKPDARVLDAPCGDGRHSIELAARGYRVTGVDLSGEFLQAAREASAARRLAVAWEHRDMRDLAWEAAFDGAYCFGNSFAYFDDAGNQRFLAGVSRALKPGTKLVLETGSTAESLMPNLESRGWYEMGDIIMLASRRYDPCRGRLDVEYSFLQDGVLDRRPASYRIYTCLEVLRLFEAAGFSGLEALGSLGGEPFQLGARCLYVVAKKT
jgi:SAM-dependent methyltransferase